MIGFVFGFLCLFAFIRLARWGRWHRWHHAYGHPGHHGPPWGGFEPPWGGYGPPWARRHHGGGRGILRMLSRRLDATPAQEKVIHEELRAARERVHGVRQGLRDGREALAVALKGDQASAESLDAALREATKKLDETRAAIAGGLARIHAALEPRQRAILADLIAEGPGAWRRDW